MQIISKDIDFSFSDPSEQNIENKIAPLDEILYLDIESTGMHAETDHIQLIGCLYHSSNTWKMIQWYDETGNQETDILESFLVFAKRYKICIHYNGDRFDFPFLRSRLNILEITGMPEMRSIDLYQLIRPCRKFLALDNYRQSTIEKLFGYNRPDSDEIGESSLPEHNEYNLQGLIRMTAAVYIEQLLHGRLDVKRAHANHYRAMDGSRSTELVIHAEVPEVPHTLLNKSLTASADDCYVTVFGNQITIKLPFHVGELKYFYANYNDYFYLPAEDMAIHKSIASFVDSSHREQAKAYNCYTRKSGKYLPEWDLFHTPFFKKEYKDKYAWFELTDELKADKKFFSEYAEYVFHHIISA